MTPKRIDRDVGERQSASSRTYALVLPVPHALGTHLFNCFLASQEHDDASRVIDGLAGAAQHLSECALVLLTLRAYLQKRKGMLAKAVRPFDVRVDADGRFVTLRGPERAFSAMLADPILGSCLHAVETVRSRGVPAGGAVRRLQGEVRHDRQR